MFFSVLFPPSFCIYQGIFFIYLIIKNILSSLVYIQIDCIYFCLFSTVLELYIYLWNIISFAAFLGYLSPKAFTFIYFPPIRNQMYRNKGFYSSLGYSFLLLLHLLRSLSLQNTFRSYFQYCPCYPLN